MNYQRWLNRNSNIGDAVTYHFSLRSQEGDVRPAVQAVRCCRQEERTQVIHFHSRSWSLLAFPAPFTLETHPPCTHKAISVLLHTSYLSLSPLLTFPSCESKSFFLTSESWVRWRVGWWRVWSMLDWRAWNFIGVNHLSPTLREPEGTRRDDQTLVLSQHLFSQGHVLPVDVGSIKTLKQVKHEFINKTFYYRHPHSGLGGHLWSSETRQSSINRLNLMPLKFNPAALIPLWKYSKQPDCAFSWLHPGFHMTIDLNCNSQQARRQS